MNAVLRFRGKRSEGTGCGDGGRERLILCRGNCCFYGGGGGVSFAGAGETSAGISALDGLEEASAGPSVLAGLEEASGDANVCGCFRAYSASVSERPATLATTEHIKIMIKRNPMGFIHLFIVILRFI